MLALDAHAEQEQPPHPDEGRNVGVRRGVGREQPHCGARRLLREGLSQPQHRQGTAQPAGVDGDRCGVAFGRVDGGVDGGVAGGVAGRRPRACNWARTAATASGSAATSAATSSVRWGDTDSRGKVTRMLPWVRAPIAASTWLGSRVLDVHALSLIHI